MENYQLGRLQRTTVKIKKRIAICGTCWFSADTRWLGQSFGEKIADRYDLELVSLARNGCGNFAISLQIDKAIELGVDFIVSNTAAWDHAEIPIIPSTDTATPDHALFNWQKWTLLQQSLYDIDQGLSNIQYHPHHDLSCKNEFLKTPTIINESLNNLAFPESKMNSFYNLTDEQITSLRLYMLNLYDENVKRQQDCWIMSDASRRLQQSQIPFILFAHPLFESKYIKNIEWLPSKNRVHHQEFDYTSFSKSRTLFHYHPKHSDEFADFVMEKLHKLGNTNELTTSGS